MKKQHLILIIFININVFAQSIVNEKLIPFRNNQKKWGYMDADSDKILIPAKYVFASLFENGIASVGINNPNSKDKYGPDRCLSGFIRENGVEMFPINFKMISDVKVFNDSILHNLKNITLENGSNGILKLHEEKWLVEPGKYNNFKFYSSTQYLADFIDFYYDGKKYSAPKDCKIEKIDFEDRFFYITKGEKESNKGICTWEGKLIVEPKYIEVQYDTETKTYLASTKFSKEPVSNFEEKNFDNFLFDKNGKQIKTYKSKEIPSINENLIYEELDSEVDKKYNLLSILPQGMIPIKIFDNFLIVRQLLENKYTYLLTHLDGRPISEIGYDGMEFANGYFIVAKDNLKGIMNAKGKVLVALKFKNILAETLNLIRIWDNKRDYYINVNSGKEYRNKE